MAMHIIASLREKRMKRLGFLAAAISILSIGPAMADTVQNAVGNRVVLTFPGGAQSTLRLHADGTVQQTAPDGQTREGTWTSQGGTYCHTFNGVQECPPIAADKNVGDTWTQAGDGGDIQISIVAGQ